MILMYFYFFLTDVQNENKKVIKTLDNLTGRKRVSCQLLIQRLSNSTIYST